MKNRSSDELTRALKTAFTAAFHAASIGNDGMIDYYLNQKGSDVNAVHPYPADKRATLLHAAASGGNVEIIRKLIEAGAIFKKDTDGREPIDYAIQEGKKDAIRELRAYAAFQGAAEGRIEPVQKYLEDPKADMNFRHLHPYANGLGLLHAAAMGGNTEIINLLLDKGAGLRMTDNDGNEPLHYAAKYNKREVYDLLVSRGALPDTPNENAETPKGLLSAHERVRTRARGEIGK